MDAWIQASSENAEDVFQVCRGCFPSDLMSERCSFSKPNIDRRYATGLKRF
jgi:hypothetical protein